MQRVVRMLSSNDVLFKIQRACLRSVERDVGLIPISMQSRELIGMKIQQKNFQCSKLHKLNILHEMSCPRMWKF
jgi:hypothetical protein